MRYTNRHFTYLLTLLTISLNKHNVFSGLWGLVNNAGLNFLGDAELTTMDQYVNEVNINQLGVVRVTKAFLPEICRRKGFSMAQIFLE